MQIELVEWIRLFILFFHVLMSALAIGLVLRTDWALIMGTLQRDNLIPISHHISLTLVALWISGLGIIYLDTGFEWSQIASNSKLQLKLVCVSVLTLNGVMLHNKILPLLINNTTRTMTSSFFLALSGAISTVHWLLAAFLGLAYPLRHFSFQLLFNIYASAMTALCLLALLSARWLSSRLSAGHTKSVVNNSQ